MCTRENEQNVRFKGEKYGEGKFTHFELMKGIFLEPILVGLI